MAKLRVYQLANQYGIPSKAFVDLLNQHNFPVKNHMSMLTDSQVEEIAKLGDSFKLESQAVQDAIDKQKNIADKEKAAKEKAEAEKKEEIRRRKAHERVELAKAVREAQEEEQKAAKEAEKARREAQKQAEQKAEKERKAKEKAEAAAKAKAKEKAKKEETDKVKVDLKPQNKTENQSKQEGKTKESEKPNTDSKPKNEKKKASDKKDTSVKVQIQQKDEKSSKNSKGKSAEKDKGAVIQEKQSGKSETQGKGKKNNKKEESTEQNRSPKKENKQKRDNSPSENKASVDNNASGKKKKKNKRDEHIDAAWEDNGPQKRGKKDKKKQNQAPAAPLKVKDHSKKEKTSHSSYKKAKAEIKSEKQKNQVYQIPENITVGDLAETFDVAATSIIMTLMGVGTMATINQEIDYDTAAFVAESLGYKVEKIAVEDVVSKILEEYDEEEVVNAVKRPPVVTVMGHVDHGKTSLLDRIRKANVTAGEAGGITQHIGAYTVTIKGEKITFIDTPGHEAFTAMRLRGAQMTDIAVLVVAADDGVMPQTVEAINHAKAADVPIIVAINKIDKDGANPERVKQELTEHNLVVEEWGGDVIAVPVSAKKGIGIEDLLENILLVAEVEELTADPKRAARGCVIEAQMKQGKGSTASLLVQQGTLHVGDTIISGMTYGKIRTMIDDKGRRIKKAGPSQPVEISGLSEVPVAGDDFIVLSSDKEARQLAEQRQQMEKDARQTKMGVNLNDLFTRIQEGQIQDINIIIKADVQGSVEAIAQSLVKLNTEEVRINVIHGAVGAVNESDVMLASTSGAIIIGFNVRPDKNALAQAEAEKVDIRLYRVIYDAIEDVKKAMEGLLSPDYVEKTTGSADVREVFRIPGGTMIAGSYVTEGKIGRNDEVRVIRDGIVVFEGKIASLRRFKDDVKEVNTGFECGIGIEKFNDIKTGDVIETFVMEAVAREL